MKIRRRLLAALSAVIVLPVAGVVSYMERPEFGRSPAGDELARIERSPNYVNGAFRNQIDTPVLTGGSSELSIWAEDIVRKKGHQRPDGPLPAIKTDLRALDIKQDLVVWLGHSSYFVQLAGKRILVDPVFSVNAAPLPSMNVAFEGTSLYAASDMPPIDLVLISHDHYDHLDYPTIVALEPRVSQVVTGLGIGADFEAWGYTREKIKEADWYDTITLADGLTIHVTPARHFSGRGFTRGKSLWAGYVLASSRHRLFFSGDSGYGPHFSEIGRRYGPFDWVTLDMGQYDARWANIHMNPEQAAKAADDLRAKAFTPDHVGRFSIAPHDWDDPFKRIAVASTGRRYALWTPVIGQPVYLDGRPQKFDRWWESVK